MADSLLVDISQADAVDDAPTPPPGWTGPPQQGFDWDQDGVAHEFRIDAGTVTVAWSTGSLVVSNVTTSFGSVQDRNGTSFGTTESTPKPAAVGDVTGDGWLDLVISNIGTVAVLAGSGSESAGRIAFADMGTSTPGWRSEPIVIREGSPRGLVPWPNSSVSIMWDTTGDGTNDFAAVGALDRSRGPVVYYAGTRCWTRA